MNLAADVTQASGLFWATVFGSALGIVSGTVIQYLMTMIADQKVNSRQRSALAKEMAYNRSLVDELSGELQKLRNAVNGDALDRYFGYFPFEKGIFAQTNGSANNGMLYEFLSTDEVKHAQRIVSVLSVNRAQWVNGEITRRKNMFVMTPAMFDKGEAISFIDFLQDEIQRLESGIEAIVRRL